MMMKSVICLAVVLVCVCSMTYADDEGALKKTLTKVTSVSENGAQKLQSTIDNGSKNLQSLVNKGSDQVRKMAEGLQNRANSYVAAQQAKAGEPRRGFISSAVRGAGRLARNVTLESARFVGSVGSNAVKMAKNTASATALAAVDSVSRLTRLGRNKKSSVESKDSSPKPEDGSMPEELKNVEAAAEEATET